MYGKEKFLYIIDAASMPVPFYDDVNQPEERTKMIPALENSGNIMVNSLIN